MCGITGAYNINGGPFGIADKVKSSNKSLTKRGPDFSKEIFTEKSGWGHSRLKIIDTSDEANQPMIDESKNHILVFNGEIFNFMEIKEDLRKKYNSTFHTRSDTEVLLQLLIHEGESAIPKLNGFFAFAFYDVKKHRLLIARDRYGEKPLLWTRNDDHFCFASEMKAMEPYLSVRTINNESLFNYFSLTYIPAPLTIYNEVSKVEPGHYLLIENGIITDNCYYKPELRQFDGSYKEATDRLKDIVIDAVEKRMISDVPLGCFLSGGIDSTIVAGIARSFDKDLHTFSIGYPNEKFFDETEYALSASKHLGTKHEVFGIDSEELFIHSNEVLDYLDEPFADSSALAVYLLSKKVRKKVTVCLSGDGADEVFGGYNKHAALLKSFNKNFQNSLIRLLYPVVKQLPGSRNSKTSNKIRQLKKYSSLLQLKPEERYWHLASFTGEKEVKNLLSTTGDILIRKPVSEGNDKMNDSLLLDLQLVLANDMLYKVDMMSMGNSLEIRPPLLDHRIIDFAFSLPSDYKIDKHRRKKILKDAFSEYLPESIQKRRKQGFEVPMKKWITEKWKDEFVNELTEKKWIERQGIFNLPAVEELKNSVLKGDFNESTVWSFIVFQKWWKKAGYEQAENTSYHQSF